MKFTIVEFEKKFVPVTETGCWLWIGNLHVSGYGQFGVKEKSWASHRASWELYRGTIPKGMCVLHKCDTRSCVNPKHLFLGTRSDNHKDMIQKRRHASVNQTHCKHGHEFTSENTMHNGRQRRCRMCIRIINRRTDSRRCRICRRVICTCYKG